MMKGCQGLGTAALWAALASAGAAVAATTAEDAGTLAGNEVVAQRDGIELTVAHIDAKVRSMPPELRAGYLHDPDRLGRMIDSQLLMRQLAALAEAGGLHETERFRGDLELQRQELLSRLQLEHYMATLETPNYERLARERYMANPDTYRGQPQIDLRHVLISTEGRDEGEAEARAAEVLAKARAGEDFIELVAAYSDEPNKLGGGLIANADGSRMDPKFAEALSGLQEVGDLVGPVRSRFGYHVVRLERHEVPPPVSFEQVREQLIKDLHEQFRSAARNRYLASLSGKDFELNGDVVRQLPERYANIHGAAPAEAGQP
jgi:peptidyl-prolyl cis-trans isomerase C